MDWLIYLLYAIPILLFCILIRMLFFREWRPPKVDIKEAEKSKECVYEKYRPYSDEEITASTFTELEARRMIREKEDRDVQEALDGDN